MRTQDALKQEAASQAAALVQPGTIVGLGAGSTASFATRRIAGRFHAGELPGILCVPCSTIVEALARELGLPLTSLDEHPAIDLTIDGADEVDPDLNLIKGGGGALLWEKIVAQASRREIIVVDESKLSAALGTRFPVPVEVTPFGWRSQAAFLEQIGGRPVLRSLPGGGRYLTDQGDMILDCRFGPIPDPGVLAAQLDPRAGIVEHGLFLGLATDLIVAGPGGVRHERRCASA